MKINKDYFYLTGWFGRWKYFINQGHLIAHLIDRFKWHILPKYYIAAPFPTHVDIEVSSACQLKCPMCTQQLMNAKQKGIMNFNLYKKIIDQCVKNHVYSIKLSWRGEPMLNPRVWDMVEYAKKKGIKDVAFLSNGERFTDLDLKRAITSGLDWISFSIDGLYDIYDKIRYPSKFKDIVIKLKKLKAEMNSRKPLVRVQTIYSAIAENPEEYFDFWQPIVDRVNFIADEVRADLIKGFKRDPNYVCPSPWQRMVITFDGTVMPCVCDYFVREDMGNINEKSLYEIWDDMPFQKIRKQHKEKRRLERVACAECCSGGITEEKTISVHGKPMKVRFYVGQDLKNVVKNGK